ncbi:MAG: transketolase [bacterium]
MSIQNEIRELEITALKVRRRVLEIIYQAKGGHTGGSLSSVDILVTLYLKIMNINTGNFAHQHRDHFIMSKGHSVESLYCTLSAAGFFPDNILDTYGKFDSPLAGHPTLKVPGVELNSGALGHGLSVGTGMALAAKRDNLKNRVFVLMGDGEQGEGSICEAAMAAVHYQLDNLIAIIDRNKLQISGATEDVLGLEPLADRWKVLGWEVTETDGNHIPSLLETFTVLPSVPNKPHLVIANTVKGKGISIIENKAGWHHKVPNEKEFALAMEELDLKMIKFTQNE